MGDKRATKKHSKGDRNPPRRSKVVADEDMADEIDAFHKQRDLIPLDVNELSGDSDDIQDSESDDTEETGLEAKLVKQQKIMSRKTGGLEDGMDDEEDIEEEPKARWGGRKDMYYNADNADIESKDNKLKMEEYSTLISCCDDLLGVLKDKKDSKNFLKCVEDVNVLRSSCDADLAKINATIQDFESKIDSCKKKTEAVKLEAISEEELECLDKELEQEQKKESLLLEDIRVIIVELERTRVSVDEQKKLEQDELSGQRTLSMLASVTDIIPDLSDPSQISGHNINRDKRAVKKFEFGQTRTNGFDTCNDIWKMIID